MGLLALPVLRLLHRFNIRPWTQLMDDGANCSRHTLFVDRSDSSTHRQVTLRLARTLP